MDNIVLKDFKYFMCDGLIFKHFFWGWGDECSRCASLLVFLACHIVSLLMFVVVSISECHLLSCVTLNTLYRNVNEGDLDRMK